eukprot:scaffold31831_cov49-Phaeocystis_antarctica.AAC.1
MSYMSVTLEVSKLSGWLNADARCRESNGEHSVSIRCGTTCGLGGGRRRAIAVSTADSTARKDVIDQAAAAGGRRRLVGREQYWQPVRRASDALPLADHRWVKGADPAI